LEKRCRAIAVGQAGWNGRASAPDSQFAGAAPQLADSTGAADGAPRAKWRDESRNREEGELASTWGPGSRRTRSKEKPLWERPLFLLFRLFPGLFPATLARQRFFHALLLAGLQIKGVSLDLLDNVFLLHLALEPAQGIFEGLTLLQSDFSQSTTPPNSPGWDLLVIASFPAQVKRPGGRSPGLPGLRHLRSSFSAPIESAGVDTSSESATGSMVPGSGRDSN